MSSIYRMNSTLISMKKLLISISLVLIALIILASGFYFGVDWAKDNIVTEQVEKETVITVPTYIEKPQYEIVEKPVYIVRPVYEIVEIPVVEEITKWRNIYPRQFESVEDFVEWYETQEFTLLYPSGDYTVDCDDYAEMVQRKALEQGYAISQALTWNGQYYDMKVNNIFSGHVGNIVLIDNAYYYFEPNPEEFFIRKLIERD